MELFIFVTHIYATMLPYIFPFAVAYLIFSLNRERKERKERVEAYAKNYDIPVKIAKKILNHNPR